jgi:hypothetical protein
LSLIGRFEQRLERGVEGFFARLFRSGVHPVEIGKRLVRVMEDGKTVALRRTYVPNVYRIALGPQDYERLAPLESKIVEELEIFLGEAARQREWALADSPRVSFATDDALGQGEFRITAEAVALERPQRSRVSSCWTTTGPCAPCPSGGAFASDARRTTISWSPIRACPDITRRSRTSGACARCVISVQPTGRS